MNEYVEDINNSIFQVFNELSLFLDCIYYFHTINDKRLKNITLDAMRLHTRAIVEFFGENRKYADDLIYTDLITTNDDLSVSMSANMKEFLNKVTAHISKKRGSISFDNKEYFGLIKELLFSIEKFMNRCEDSLKNEYQKDYQMEDVEVLKEYIQIKLVQVAECMINA